MSQKEYEVSLWKDHLKYNSSTQKYYTKEEKMAILAKDDLEDLRSIYDIVLAKDINGTNTLKFSIVSKYFDLETGTMIKNELVSYLINKTKIKIKFNNEWFTFVINKKNEKKDAGGLIYTYECDDLIINDLSKKGYTLSFDETTGFGNIVELTNKVLLDTPWTLDEDNTDLFGETEDTYSYTFNETTQEYDIAEVSNNIPTAAVTFNEEVDRWVYRYTELIDGLDLRSDPFGWVKDWYTPTMGTPPTYTVGQYVQINGTISTRAQITYYSILGQDGQEQLLVFNLIDAITLESIVEPSGSNITLYKENPIYKYSDTETIQAGSVYHMIKNNSDFETTSGYTANGILSGTTPSDIHISAGGGTLDITSVNADWVYLNTDVLAVNGYRLEPNRLYYFHIKNEHDGMIPIYVKSLQIRDGSFTTSLVNNYAITPTAPGASILENWIWFKTDRIIENPYITIEFKFGGNAFVFSDISLFQLMVNENYRGATTSPYTIAEANAWYNTNLFGTPLFGSVPTEYRPSSLKTGETGFDSNPLILTPYSSPYSIAQSTYITPFTKTFNTYFEIIDGVNNYLYPTNIIQIFSNQKNRTLIEEKSNRFNLLQSICELFSAWLKVSINYDSNGYFELAESGEQIRQVCFKKIIGEEKGIGFNYDINIDSLERNIVSDEVVTKMYVEIQENQYVDSNTISIANSQYNTSGENFIYNFNYYIQQGLVDNKRMLDYLYSESGLYKNLETANQYISNLNKIYLASLTEYNDLKSTIDLLKKQISTLQTNITTKESQKAKLTTASEIAVKQKIINDLTAEKIAKESSLLVNEQNYLTLENNIYGIKYTVAGGYWGSRSAFLFSTAEIPSDWAISTVVQICGTTGWINPTTTAEIIGMEYSPFGEQDIIITLNGYNQEAIPALGNQEGIYLSSIGVVGNKTTGGYIGQIEDWTNYKIDRIKAFEQQYSQYINEGTWTDSNYIDSDKYYLDSLKVSKTSAFPKVEYTISAIDLSQVTDWEDYNFNIGDRTFITDPDIFGKDSLGTPIKEDFTISKIEYEVDKQTSTISLQNYDTQFEDLFERISASVQSLEFKETIYEKASNFDSNGAINVASLQKAFVENTVDINASTDGSVRILDNGILLQDIDGSYIQINGKGLLISGDNGLTWKSIVDSKGINADFLALGAIDTSKVNISNQSQVDISFATQIFDKLGLSSHQNNSTFMRFDQYGFYNAAESGFQYTDNDGRPWSEDYADPAAHIRDNAKFSLTKYGLFGKDLYTTTLSSSYRKALYVDIGGRIGVL